MKNRLSDLNNHLFAQIERLGEEDLGDDALKREVERAKALTGVSGQITDIAKMQLQAAALQAQYGPLVRDYLPALETPKISAAVTRAKSRQATKAASEAANETDG